MKFICPHCNKETEDTIGGVLVDGFILECSECFDTTIIHFEAAQHSVQADGWRCPECDGINPDDVGVCESCGYSKARRR